MKNIIFTTRNKHKIEEVAQLVNESISVGGLDDIHCEDELPETSGTIKGNAIEKAKFVFDNYHGINCFSEDTGLEIDALNGAPGVDTAFYAGKDRNDRNNMNLVLEQMKDCSERTARFRTVIALYWNAELHLFEGICEGVIDTKINEGAQGFGYDPIFIPQGFTVSFAQMPADVKNTISHRGKAVKQLIDFLLSND
ncbi:MAG: RdgB/HAM1 family non-canonical purine NTP pyrophosphatase [Saprospiraceae bacterium]|nr:RdgB/HAM1 family non-canonical purine NTP pyrophosphatase [Saprospiraceae bacterium]